MLSGTFYDIIKDPSCLNNLANRPQLKKTKNKRKSTLVKYLNETKYPRILGKGAVFEAFPRYEGVIREYPAPKK